MLSGERGIWTLAPVLPTYSLSRGAPSASLGISPCRYLQSKFLNIIIFIVWFQEESHWFSELRSGEDGIRTHVPVRTNGFQDRRVMTTSLPLQNGGAAPFVLVRTRCSRANKWYIIRTLLHCQCSFLIFFKISFIAALGTAKLHYDIKVKTGCHDHGTAIYQTH